MRTDLAPTPSLSSRSDRALLLRARLVLPLRRPPIEDGAVAIAGDRIISVGSWRAVRRRTTGVALDLGRVAVLPGLVNAHCHLDYTQMAGLIPPLRSFTDWIKSITTLKTQWTDDEFVASWQAGAAMLVRSGTTTVADVEAVPNLLPAAWQTTPLRVLSFLEMTGVRSRRDPESILAQAIACAESLPNNPARVGLSPHAPYSTTPTLLRLSQKAARRRRWRLVTHIAESAEEFEMFAAARGPMFDWLRRNERNMSDCDGHSPVAHLARIGYLGDQLIAVHLNYLADGDADRLAHARVHVVHCPRSHAYFGHQAFPWRELTRAGAPISLGTDSLATVRQLRRQPVALDLFAEMQAFAAVHPEVPPRDILRMVTVHPARALGWHGQIGELAAGACADVITLPYAGKVTDVYDAVVHHPGDVSGSLIGGCWVQPPDLA
jgi:cytosine/adenosine deaminase-related metal-dependent hydrolase